MTRGSLVFRQSGLAVQARHHGWPHAGAIPGSVLFGRQRRQQRQDVFLLLLAQGGKAQDEFGQTVVSGHQVGEGNPKFLGNALSRLKVWEMDTPLIAVHTGRSHVLFQVQPLSEFRLSHSLSHTKLAETSNKGGLEARGRHGGLRMNQPERVPLSPFHWYYVQRRMSKVQLGRLTRGGGDVVVAA